MVVMGCVTPSYADVLAAWERIRSHVRQTPVLEIDSGMLKLENLQHTGAYKVRGACNALFRRHQLRPFKAAVTASAGNHAAGLTYACNILGVQAIAVVPITTPKIKVENCRALGCRVIRAGQDLRASMQLARQMADGQDTIFLHPFDDPDVICGQGSIGLELAQYNPDLVFVPIGGGGLASGVGLSFSKSHTRVVGVQIEGADVMNRCIRKLPPIQHVNAGLADGVNVQKAGQLTQKICEQELDDIIVVRHRDVIETVALLANTHHLVVEAAGALSVTAQRLLRVKNSISIVSGGNISLSVLSDLYAERNKAAAA